MPAVSRVQAYGHGRWLGALRQWPAPANHQWCIHLRKRQGCAVPAKPITCVGSRASVPLSLEDRVGRALREEVCVGTLEMPEAILQSYARHLIQKDKIRILLEQGKPAVLGWITNRLLGRGPRLGSFPQSAVVDQPHATEGPTQQCRLLDTRIEAIAEGPKHACILWSVTVRSQPEAALHLPGLKPSRFRAVAC